MKEYRRLCFANGTEVFLTIDPDDRTIEVQLKGEKDSHIFVAGEMLEIRLLGVTASLPVDEMLGAQ